MIVKIYISRMYESCGRATFYVMVETDEGLTRAVESHQTGSVYTNFEGIDENEALDRALIDADTWGDFLQITPEPYFKDSKICLPSMRISTYTYQRELEKRRILKTYLKGQEND